MIRYEVYDKLSNETLMLTEREFRDYAPLIRAGEAKFIKVHLMSQETSRTRALQELEKFLNLHQHIKYGAN